VSAPDFESAPVVLDVAGLSVRLAGWDEGPPLVDGVSFQIRQGETLCLVGESGSGKSVTSLAIMGLLPKGALLASGERLTLAGEDLLTASPRRLRQLRATTVSMIFQEPMTALNPVVPVGRQIDEVLRAHTRLGSAERRQRIMAIMEQVRLPDVERIYASYPHQLSGGQRQRIMIAMALVLDPKLLIADEPTTALDVTTQKQILALIRELQERHNTAVLFITHDMGVVAEIADRVCVMRSGKIVEVGPLDRILRAPEQAYTQELLRSVPSLIPRPRRSDADAPVILHISGLDKTYRERSLFGRAREVAAARDVGIEVRQGRTLGIVGESGSGKSTVARCIARLIQPTGGSIRIRGQEISGLSRRAVRPFRRHIQIVFQDPYRSLNPRRTVGAAIVEGPMNFGMARAAAFERARELLKIVGLMP
jgi:peptide/nickel transport system ATP-binding protein